jgi:AcrR family transcriptional regulator
VRTIYRYFPTKQALIDDVATAVFRRLPQLREPPDGVARDPERWLPALWGEFARDITGIRAQHASPAGAELRERRLRKSREVLTAQLVTEHPDATSDDLATYADALIAITSSRMFLELHDRMGRPVDEAVDLAMWMVRAVQHEFRTTGAP